MNLNSDFRSPAFLGHPKGLFYLFFAELWERFSFYGMRALLILYMTKQLLYSDNMSFGVYAAYMSLVYITPTLGGMLADKYLGYRKAILWGGLFMALGHFLLTIETPLFYYGSLALIIVGNGFFKPNISSLVGTLYAKDDKKRDSAFTIFYMGVNIGGAAAPLLCAWLAEIYGWHAGFMSAGIGMLLGLFIFHRAQKQQVFGDQGLPPSPSTTASGISQEKLILLAAICSVPLFACMVYFHAYEHHLIWIISSILLIALGIIFKRVSTNEKKRLAVAVYFTLLATVFWAIFEQAGSSLTLFADRNVNLIGVNASQMNSVNSAFIILLALPFSMLWMWLNRLNLNPNSAVKFGLGLLFLGLAFIVFASSGQHFDEFARTPMSYLILGYFIMTVGEMCLSPIGLSKMTELSPLKYAAFIMGVWFSSSFFGHFISGKIAKLTTVTGDGQGIFSTGIWAEMTEGVTGLEACNMGIMGPTFEQLYAYTSVYAGFGIITLLLGVVALVLSPFVKKLMVNVR